MLLVRRRGTGIVCIANLPLDCMEIPRVGGENLGSKNAIRSDSGLKKSKGGNEDEDR